MSNNATQEFVPIDDVRDGIVILKSGGMRGILMASSVNFSLKSQSPVSAHNLFMSMSRPSSQPKLLRRSQAAWQSLVSVTTGG
jgi:hypothetical protein